MKFRCLFVFILTILRYEVEAQTSVSVIGHVSAEIIPVFSATETAQMNFGRFSPGPQGGQIILTPESTISALGSVYTGTGLHNAACFFLTGHDDTSFTLTLPAGPVILNHVSKPMSMTIEKLISNPGTGTSSGVLHNGSGTVYVGAVLKVGTLEDNPIGIYSGTYSVTFDFN